MAKNTENVTEVQMSPEETNIEVDVPTVEQWRIS